MTNVLRVREENTDTEKKYEDRGRVNVVQAKEMPGDTRD